MLRFQQTGFRVYRIKAAEEKKMNKKQFYILPESMKNMQFWGFSWLEYVLSVPSPLVLVTGYKNNGLANATMDSWLCFSSENEFYCIFGSVDKRSHMYEVVKNQKQLVVNFPDKDVLDRCMSTIQNNFYDKDELALAGLSYQNGSKVNAPVAEDCFLNLECEVAWEKPLFEGSNHFVVCTRVVNVWFDEEHYNSEKLGRYGESGYLYNIRSTLNPETGEREPYRVAVIDPIKTV